MFRHSDRRATAPRGWEGNPTDPTKTFQEPHEIFEAIRYYTLGGSCEPFIYLTFDLLLKKYFIFRACRTAAREK